MSTLSGKAPGNTFKDLLQVSQGLNTGIVPASITVTDGEGTESTLALSTTAVTINGLVYPTTDGTLNQAVVTDGAGNLSFASVAASVAFNDLTDVTITSAASGDYIRYDGAAWVDVAAGQLETDINHDNLTGFVANEHLDWTNETNDFYTTGVIVAGSENEKTIIIGGSSFNANFHSHVDSATDFDYNAHRHSATASAAAVYMMARSRGTGGAETVIVTGDRLGEIVAVGHDGTDYAFGARIQFDSTGTIGANTIPTNIVFKVAPDGGGGAATAMTINEDKNVDFANGIDVTGAITVTSTVDGRDVAADGTTLDGITTGLTAGSVIFSNGTTLIEDNTNFFWDDTNNRLGLGIATPSHTLEVVGDLELMHTATTSDDHALEIVVDTSGFGDVKALDIDFITGAIAAGQNEESIVVNIDESLSTGGTMTGYEVLTTTVGSAAVYGYTAGVGVHPLLNEAGTFGDMDYARYTTSGGGEVDCLTAFTSTGTDVTMFTADNDYIIVGDAATFEEMEFILATAASGAGIAPTFQFSTGGAGFTTFSPTDGTNGFRNTGLVNWLLSDISGTWATNTSGNYEIKIIRTRNSLSTAPIEDLVQIAAVTEYSWNKDGTVTIKNVDIAASNAYSVAGTAILSDSAGTMTLSNIDAIDATTETTLEAAIDTLSNLTTTGALNAGSITSGFGGIDNGSSAITTTGTISATSFVGALTGNADTVTTNANLTGDVTSSGNATTIAAKAVDVAMLADGTDGELITWDASGVAATVAVGTSTHVLTSNGVGVAPTFQASAAGAPEGTAVLSTGEVGGTKFLREDGDGTCSWQAAAGSGDMVLADIQTVTGAKTFDSTKLIYAGSTSGTTTVNATAVAGTTTLTLPAATDTLVGKATTDTLTNKTINTASNTITVVEADVSDLGSYITASSTDTLTNKTFDANGTGNSLSNVDLTADVTGTLPVTSGGSGATTLTDGGVLVGSGTGAVTAMAVLADSEMIVGDGTTDPVAESGTTLRTSIGVAIGSDVQAFDADILKADTADVLTAGFAHTDYAAGTKSSGTYTPDEANGNFQTATNGGAHTLAPTSNSANVIIQYTNNGSAGAITTSGFTIVTGDAFTTTNGHDFLCYLTKVSTFSHLNVVALQ